MTFRARTALVLAVAALALTGCTERVEVPVYAPRMQPVIVQAPASPGDLASLVARHEVTR